MLIFCCFLTGSAVFPHVDVVVIRKSMFGISVCLDLDIFLFFLFTCFVKYFREEFLRKRIRRIPLGLVFFIFGRSLPQTRYHRDRLNFIKPFISVCFESLLGINFFCSIIYIGINRQKIRGWSREFSVCCFVCFLFIKISGILLVYRKAMDDISEWRYK